MHQYPEGRDPSPGLAPRPHGASLGYPYLSRIVLVTVALLLLARAALWAGWGMPAPRGDSVFFFQASFSGCSGELFRTPVYPLDPDGRDRYLWHGIGQPLLIWLLSPACSAQGLFIGMTLLVLLGLGGLWATLRHHLPGAVIAALAVVVLAVQAQAGFRPELLAASLLVIAEVMRFRGSLAWPLFVSLVGWVQPTSLILHLIFTGTTWASADARTLLGAKGAGITIALAFNLLALALYPFPLEDHLWALAEQGRLFAARTDGDLFTYFVRSDFFPLSGALAILALGVVGLLRPMAVILLMPAWYFGMRVPPGSYNLMPLLGACMVYAVLRAPEQGFRRAAIRAALVITSVCASLGLAQGILRDVHSLVRFDSSVDRATRYLAMLNLESLPLCSLAGPMVALIDASQYASSREGLGKGCDEVPHYNILESSRLPSGTEGCQDWPTDRGRNLLSRLFRSDSGYAFTLCTPHVASGGPKSAR